MKDKAQTMSADALIAVALFMVAIIFFFSLSNDTSEEKKAKDLQAEVAKLTSSLSGNKNFTEFFISGSKVNEQKLKEAATLDYRNLKDVLGVDADFCIHFEDDEGNVLNVSGNKTGLGSPLIIVGGVSCG